MNMPLLLAFTLFHGRLTKPTLRWCDRKFFAAFQIAADQSLAFINNVFNRYEPFAVRRNDRLAVIATDTPERVRALHSLPYAGVFPVCGVKQRLVRLRLLAERIVTDDRRHCRRLGCMPGRGAAPEPVCAPRRCLRPPGNFPPPSPARGPVNRAVCPQV